MITKIVAGRELKLNGRWDTEETTPYGGTRIIKLRGSFVGSGPNARAMLGAARAEYMAVVELCSHSDGVVDLVSMMGSTEIRMPARYIGMKLMGDKATAQAGCFVELEFRCLSKFWLGDTVSTMGSLATGTCRLTMVNGGTAPARPAVIIRPEKYYKGTITVWIDDGRWVRYEEDTQYLGAALVFDMSTHQIYRGSYLVEGRMPKCKNYSQLIRINITDMTFWFTTAWGVMDDEVVTITATSATSEMTAELVHINEYY